MKKVFLLTILLALFAVFFLYRPAVFAFGGCESDCQKCHTLSTGEARDILKKMNAAGSKVIDIRMSPIGGLWQVIVEDKGQKGIMYVSFSKKYIVGGAIFEVATAANKTQETLASVLPPAERSRPAETFVDVSKIPLEGSLVLGDRSAPNKVVVFTDPECPFCARLHEELKKIVPDHKDIAFYLKLFPLKIHADSDWKSRSILCAGSLQLLDDNFEKKPIPKPDCAGKQVDENIKLGGELGVTGTPTMIMPDGYVVSGALEAAEIIELISAHGRKETK